MSDQNNPNAASGAHANNISIEAAAEGRKNNKLPNFLQSVKLNCISPRHYRVMAKPQVQPRTSHSMFEPCSILSHLLLHEPSTKRLLG
ncbi:hypothetical protein K1719_005979 [Acacia pycnantha]|nr:hypothetical protein K1719_005979 [Acacia pycnantha]